MDERDPLSGTGPEHHDYVYDSRKVVVVEQSAITRVDPHSASFSVEKQREPYALGAGEVVLRDSHIAPKSFIGSFIRKWRDSVVPHGRRIACSLLLRRSTRYDW
jgi:hypothetical protein